MSAYLWAAQQPLAGNKNALSVTAGADSSVGSKGKLCHAANNGTCVLGFRVPVNPVGKYLTSILKPGLFLVYLLILLEGIYMTSFFAVYLFSTYVPIQSLLEQSPAFG